MKALFTVLLVCGIAAASAQTMPNANQTPEQSNSGPAMPNANRTPEGANNLPNGDGTLTPPADVSPYGTTVVGPQSSRLSSCGSGGAACPPPACPPPPVPPPAGSPQAAPLCPTSPVP